MSSRMASKTALDCTSYRFSSSCQVGVGCGHPTQPDESAHDLDVDGDRPRAVQDTREHRDALLGEGVRRVSATAKTF